MRQHIFEQRVWKAWQNQAMAFVKFRWDSESH